MRMGVEGGNGLMFDIQQGRRSCHGHLVSLSHYQVTLISLIKIVGVNSILTLRQYEDRIIHIIIRNFVSILMRRNHIISIIR